MQRPKNLDQMIFAALPGDPRTLAKKTGLSISSIHGWIKPLRADELCYIKRWKKTAGLYAPWYVAGKGVDAPKPTKKDFVKRNLKYHRDYYHKHLKHRDKERRDALREARQNADRMAQIGDPLVLALFGHKKPAAQPSMKG